MSSSICEGEVMMPTLQDLSVKGDTVHGALIRQGLVWAKCSSNVLTILLSHEAVSASV